MPDDLSEAIQQNIPLSEMIQTLRQELQVSLSAGREQKIQFLIERIDLELQIAISRGREAGGGVAFSVLSANAKAQAGIHTVHNFKISLSAVTATGEKQKISSDGLAGPPKKKGV